MPSKRLVEINIYPSDGVHLSPNAKTVLWIGAGAVLVVGTGGVAAGVMLSGGTWAAFGTAVVSKGAVVTQFVVSNVTRSVIGATAVSLLKQYVGVRRRRQ